MDKKSLRFLEELISTPSPSGDESQIQKKYYEYIKDFTKDITTDNAGNVIGIINPKSKFKVLISGHCDEIAFIVQHITDKGLIHVNKSGGISPNLSQGKRVKILGYGATLDGVVGVLSEHQSGTKAEVKIEDVYIDVGANSKEELADKVRVGDYIIYNYDFNYLLNDNFVGRGLDNRTGSFIAAEILRELSTESLEVGVYSSSTVNEETNKFGAYTAASTIKPDISIVCDVTFATDYPGNDVKKHGDVKLGCGPALSFGAPINKKINDRLIEIAKENNIALQFELTPRNTGTDADRIRYTNQGVPTALISLPLRYMHSPSEVVNLKDIENIIKLLKAFLLSIDENFDAKPFSFD